MPDRSRRPLPGPPAFRLLGHPIVLGLLGLTLVASVLSLILTVAEDSASTTTVILRVPSVLILEFATLRAWRAFQARRRFLNR